MNKIFMASPFFTEGDKKIIHNEVENILSNQLSMGKNVEKFEQLFSKRINVKHSIALNACTSALEASVRYAATRGNEIIIPAQTFIATGMAVHLSGLKPVLQKFLRKLCALIIMMLLNELTKILPR